MPFPQQFAAARWRRFCRITAAAALLCLSATATAATDLLVSAASSLSSAFQDLAGGFEQRHPGVKVINNFAASDILMQQIVRGAPVDIFAAADQTAMDKAVAAQAVQAGSRRNFAANQIVLIVPHDSQLPLHSLEDLTKARFQRIALGNPATAPFGRYTQAALEQAGLWQSLLAKGVMAQNVRQSLDYVARGEVDAGFVFATDAAVMPDKVKIALPIHLRQPATYPIAITSDTPRSALASQYLAYVLSPEGQAVLARYGFLKP